MIVGARPYTGPRHWGGQRADLDELMESVSGHYGHPYMRTGQGGDPTGQTGPQFQPSNPAAYAAHPDGPMLIDRQPTDLREFPIGFQSPGVVAPAAQTSVSALPQVAFRGERLVVVQSICTFFTINDIKVGKDSQLAVAGNLAAEGFSNLSVGVRTLLDTAEPGIQIVILATNTDPAAASHVFSALLFGTVID
jgi:hypothetical protein